MKTILTLTAAALSLSIGVAAQAADAPQNTYHMPLYASIDTDTLLGADVFLPRRL